MNSGWKGTKRGKQEHLMCLFYLQSCLDHILQQRLISFHLPTTHKTFSLKFKKEILHSCLHKPMRNIHRKVINVRNCLMKLEMLHISCLKWAAEYKASLCCLSKDWLLYDIQHLLVISGACGTLNIHKMTLIQNASAPLFPPSSAQLPYSLNIL